jgi:hypothetical protein
LWNEDSSTNQADHLIFSSPPGKCMTIIETTGAVELDHDCNTSLSRKFWQVDYDCAGAIHLPSRFDTATSSALRILKTVVCAIWRSVWSIVTMSEPLGSAIHGNLHKTGPNAHFLYNARCWFDKGLVSALATPSLEAKTCPEDHSVGACQRLEWNLDRFSSRGRLVL